MVKPNIIFSPPCNAHAQSAALLNYSPVGGISSQPLDSRASKVEEARACGLFNFLSTPCGSAAGFERSAGGKAVWFSYTIRLKPEEDRKLPTTVDEDGTRRAHLPLTLKLLQSKWCLPFEGLGKRPGGQTNELVVDVDRGSPYHPANNPQAFRRLLGAFEVIGCVRHIITTSSESGGLHVRFPFDQPVKSWTLANAAANAVRAAGFEIKGGTLELFPNVKSSRDALYNAYRLPLQVGSYILDEDFNPYSDRPAEFMRLVHWAASGNDFTSGVEVVTRDNPAPPKKRESNVTVTASNALQRDELPPFAFTERGKTNNKLGQMAYYAWEQLGLRTVDAIAGWLRKVVEAIPGARQFISKESWLDIRKKHRDWCWRWAKTVVGRKQKQRFKEAKDWNSERHDESLKRIQEATLALENEGKRFKSCNTAIAALIEKGKELHGQGSSKRNLLKVKEIWEGLLEPVHTVNTQQQPAPATATSVSDRFLPQNSQERPSAATPPTAQQQPPNEPTPAPKAEPKPKAESDRPSSDVPTGQTKDNRRYIEVIPKELDKVFDDANPFWGANPIRIYQDEGWSAEIWRRMVRVAGGERC